MVKIISLVLFSALYALSNSSTAPDFHVDALLDTILKQYDSARTSKDSNQTVLLAVKIKEDQPIVHQVKQSIVKTISNTSLNFFNAHIQLARQHIKVIKADAVINEIGAEVLVQEYRVREHSKVIESNLQALSIKDIDEKIVTIDFLLEQAHFTGAKLDPTVRAQIVPLFTQLIQEVGKVQKQFFQIYYNELEQIHFGGKELDLKQKYEIEVLIDFYQYVGLFVDIFQHKL